MPEDIFEKFNKSEKEDIISLAGTILSNSAHTEAIKKAGNTAARWAEANEYAEKEAGDLSTAQIRAAGLAAAVAVGVFGPSVAPAVIVSGGGVAEIIINADTYKEAYSDAVDQIGIIKEDTKETVEDYFDSWKKFRETEV